MVKITHDIDIYPYNTFHLHCSARNFTIVSSVEDAQTLLQDLETDISKILILGGGSNILLQDDIYDWLVVKNEIMWKEIIAQDKSSVTIKIWAGENRDEFVRRSIEQWYTGIEQLVSIPWCVWASPMQNIWAYGVEVKDVITEVEYIHIETWETKTLSNPDCKFWYRESIFKKELKWQVIITYVSMKLGIYTPQTYSPNISYGAIEEKLDTWNITPKLLAKTITQIRESKLPDWTKLGTAWSFFKNPYISSEQFEQLQKKHPEVKGWPVSDSPLDEWEMCTIYKLSAWQLIDLAGLKWYRSWDAGTYEKHALVLINHGSARGTDLVQVARHIQEVVEYKFGVEIEMEVNLA